MIVVISLHIWVPRRNIETLSEHTRIRVRSPCGSWFWQRMWSPARRVSTGASAAKGRSGKMWACCLMGQGTWWQMTQKKLGKLHDTFAFVLTGKICLQQSQVSETKRKGKENSPSVEEDQARELLNKLDILKSMRPDKMYHEYSGNWLMSLWGHSRLSLKGHSHQETSLKTGKE